MKRSHRPDQGREPACPELAPTEESSEQALLALCFPSDRMYLVSVTEKHYVFTHVGNAMRIREDLFPEQFPADADKTSRRKKDIWIEKAAVRDFRLTMKHCISTNLPNNALLKLALSDGKRYTMILCMEEEKKTYLEFFRDVANRRDPAASQADCAANTRAEEREQRRLAQEKRRQERDAALAKQRTKKGNLCAAVACWGLCAVDILLFFFSSRAKRDVQTPFFLLCMALEAAALFLVWRWPAYFSLRDKDRLRTKLPGRKNNMILQIILPLGDLFLASVGPEYYDDVAALICICAAVVGLLIWLVLWLIRSHELTKGELIGWVFLLLMFGAGLPLSLNIMLSSKLPNDSRTAVIEEMDVSEGKYSDSYHLTLQIDGDSRTYDISKDYYEALEVGETVSVGSWSGGIGIPYSKVIEPEPSAEE